MGDNYYDIGLGWALKVDYFKVKAESFQGQALEEFINLNIFIVILCVFRRCVRERYVGYWYVTLLTNISQIHRAYQWIVG